MSNFKTETKGKFPMKENVEYQLRDKDGNVRPIFVMNSLGEALVRLFRKFAGDPYDGQGQTIDHIRPGLLNRLAIYGLAIPGLTGTWADKLVVSNLVTSAGKAGVASRINGSGGEAAFTFIAIGTGATAAAIGDTTLQAEITTNGGQRAAAVASRVTTTVTNDTSVLILTYTFTGAFAVTESGVLNAGAAGTLLNRQVFAAVNVVSTDTLQVTHRFAVS